ncbi:MAG: hypothetical protein C0467_21035 [Planctomycetaceae bacterium]|nr:hypothetical protein [Planctomycetaceae bacterium]
MGYSGRTACAVALLATLPGCDEKTREPVPLRAAILLDVDGMHGGRNVWLAEDGTAVIQVIGHSGPHGLPETRYRVACGKASVTEAERLAGAHRFLDLRLKLTRSGLPGSSAPLVALLTKDGGQSTSIKWERDNEPDFDPLYAQLYHLSVTPPDVALIQEYIFDWDWHPDGFPPPNEIRSWSR